MIRFTNCLSLIVATGLLPLLHRDHETQRPQQILHLFPPSSCERTHAQYPLSRPLPIPYARRSRYKGPIVIRCTVSQGAPSSGSSISGSEGVRRPSSGMIRMTSVTSSPRSLHRYVTIPVEPPAGGRAGSLAQTHVNPHDWHWWNVS